MEILQKNYIMVNHTIIKNNPLKLFTIYADEINNKNAIMNDLAHLKKSIKKEKLIFQIIKSFCRHKISRKRSFNF